MKRIYNWLAKPAKRNLTVADIIASKEKKKLTQVRSNLLVKIFQKVWSEKRLETC